MFAPIERATKGKSLIKALCAEPSCIKKTRVNRSPAQLNAGKSAPALVTSAGALFPALSWAGLLLTLVFLMQLGSAHNAFIRLLPFVALSIGANIFYQAPVLNNWIALDT